MFPAQSFTLPFRMRSGIFFQIYKEAERRANVFAHPTSGHRAPQGPSRLPRPVMLHESGEITLRRRNIPTIFVSIMKNDRHIACEFARRHGFPGAVYLGEWLNYKLFVADTDLHVGLPQYILVADTSVRFATPEETESIFFGDDENAPQKV